MPRLVLLPCSCGKIHQVPDPQRNMRLKCKHTGAPLVYECFTEGVYRLRGEEKDVLLDQEEMTIGRGAGCTVVLARGQLSRQHCRLRLTRDGYEIEDLKSTNGTCVNEVKLAPGETVLLRPGDLVRFANRRFRYLVPEEEPSSAVGAGRGADTEQLAAVGLEKTDEVPPDDKMVGKNLGDFEILAYMGQGGMGRVYRARQNRTGREAVVKTIIPEEVTDAKAIDRFLREIDLGARIEHPNIVEFLGTGQTGTTLYMAMEYFAGKNLRDWFSKKPASIKAAVAIGRQIADALSAAHAMDVIHRDIKPENVLLNEKGKVKVIDFGIAKARSDSAYTSLTMTGAVIGTPRYMAPEQITDTKNVTPATDVYALGAVLYYCLTCRPPRSGKSMVEIIRSIKEPPAPPTQYRPDIPRTFEAVLLKALAPQPGERFAAAGEMEAALAAI